MLYHTPIDNDDTFMSLLECAGKLALGDFADGT
jgi:hypothetical protein